MTVAELIAVLFPHFVRLHVGFVRVSGRTVRLQVRGREPSAACPGCGAPSARVHSRYERRLDIACRLVAAFAGMLVNRRGQENLEGWVRSAENSPLPELRGFATGLRRDWAAVQAGLTLHWNSGMVEGHVNRIKMIKRQMFGRAKPDLLRKRIPLAH
ncbi:transposase [Streptomyces sp. NPDC001774]